MEDYNHLCERILFQVLGKDLKVTQVDMQSGGCINMSVCARTTAGNFFIKWNELEYQDMFEKEALGLAALAQVKDLVIPSVIGTGNVEEKAFIVQEFLEKVSPRAADQQLLGEGLAQLHHLQADHYGFNAENYIGRLRQKNERESSWAAFFKKHRLEVQLGLAIYNGEVDDKFVQEMKAFLNKLDTIMPASPPSLLHGDLWSGNVFFTAQGPALFDPAPYYGAREMDLAMTKLFGGFDESFYEAYHSNYPLDPSFKELVDVYNLYPLMVHVNLFGANSGYLGMVKRIIKRYA
jgi:protein-ribulosamine 3-kinase